MTSRQGWLRHSGYAETPCCGQITSAATISHVTLDVFSPTSTTRVYPLPKTAGVALGSGKPNLNVGPFNIFKALALTDADLRALRGVASRRLFGRRDYSVCRFTCAAAELMPHPRRAAVCRLTKTKTASAPSRGLKPFSLRFRITNCGRRSILWGRLRTVMSSLARNNLATAYFHTYTAQDPSLLISTVRLS